MQCSAMRPTAQGPGRSDSWWLIHSSLPPLRRCSLCLRSLTALAEAQVLKELRKLYAAEAAQRRKSAKQGEKDSDAAAAASSAAAIPRFYVKRTTSPPPAEASEAPSESADGGAPLAPRQSLSAQVRREARTRYLENRAELLIDDRELAALWDAIQSHSVDTPTNQPNAPSPAGSGDASSGGGGGGSRSGIVPFESEKRLHYDGFVEVSRLLTPVKVRRYMRPSIFLSFPQDAQGRISSRALWRFICKKMQMTRLRISLTCYDDVGYGYLREQDLENFVYDQICTMPPLASVERDFYPYYVFTAVRKFIFMLDVAKRGKLKIRDVVESSVMHEFDALRYAAGHTWPIGASSSGGIPGLGKKGPHGGWFSAQHTQEVYAVYLGLDSNQNGMLSREEFRQYNGGNLTAIFIEGLFQQYRMYPSSSGEGEEQGDGSHGGQQRSHADDSDGSSGGGMVLDSNELEMDYKTFLDFVLAMEYKTSPASQAYFFRILDQDSRGYLDARTIGFWFRAVSEKMALLGHEQINVDVVAVSRG